MPSRHVVLAGRADQYLAGCWQSQESTKLCTRDCNYGHHHYHRRHYHHYRHHYRRDREEDGGILGVTVLRPHCYRGDKLRKGGGGAKEGMWDTIPS